MCILEQWLQNKHTAPQTVNPQQPSRLISGGCTFHSFCRASTAGRRCFSAAFQLVRACFIRPLLASTWRKTSDGQGARHGLQQQGRHGGPPEPATLRSLNLHTPGISTSTES